MIDKTDRNKRNRVNLEIVIRIFLEYSLRSRFRAPVTITPVPSIQEESRRIAIKSFRALQHSCSVSTGTQEQENSERVGKEDG